MKKITVVSENEICIDDYKLEGDSKNMELQDAKGLTQKNKDNNFTEKLVLYAKQGDIAAEEILIANFKPLIYKELLRVKVKNFDYDDMAQIGYITVMLAIRKYIPNPCKGNFTAYVTKCVRNRFCELVRQNARYNTEESMDTPSQDNGATLGDTLSSNFNLENNIIFNEDMTDLYNYIKKLPEKYREIIIDCVLKDMTMKDYAKNRNLSYRVVVQRKHRAVIMLREMMVQD